MSNDYIAALIPRLTVNAAITLRHRDPALGHMRLGSVHTGLGKWTILAAIGVFNNLRAAGCAVEEEHRPGHSVTWNITPLGAEVAAYLRNHWEEVSPLLRHSVRR